MSKYKKQSHVIYKCDYHMVWVPNVSELSGAKEEAILGESFLGKRILRKYGMNK